MPIIASLKRYTPSRAKHVIRRLVLPSQPGRNVRVDSPSEQPVQSESTEGEPERIDPAPRFTIPSESPPRQKVLLEHAKRVGWMHTFWSLTYPRELGHELSFQLKRPVDKHGNPIPWITYPAIEYLSSLDWSSKRVLEFGAGHSSLFWASRAADVVSVESNADWYQEILPQLPENVTLEFKPNKEDYIAHGESAGGLFDVIFVDGVDRFECIQRSIHLLAEGGLLLLDNSDWHPTSTEFLRAADLIQIDFTGMCPTNLYASTTSLFLKPTFRPTPLSDRLPQYGAGAIVQLARGE